MSRSRVFHGWLLIVTSVALLAACSGGGSVAHDNSAAPPGPALLQLSFTIPRPASGGSRQTRYISTASASFGIFLAPAGQAFATTPTAVADVATNCTSSGAGQSCSTTVPVASGSATLNVRAYQGAGATGAVLSAASTTVTLYANATNRVALTLNGIVTSVQLAFATSSLTVPVTLAGATPPPVGMSVTARDAAGQPITGTASFADANGAPLTIALGATNGATVSTGSITAPTSGLWLDLSQVAATSVTLVGTAGAIPINAGPPLTLTFAAAGVVTSYAGVIGTSGADDGDRHSAHFSYPAGIAVDALHTIYVADTNNGVIRKIAADGTVTTFAGATSTIGDQDGEGAGARFHTPYGLAVDANNTLYVADRDNNTIRKITATGTVTTLAGSSLQAGSADGPALQALFRRPVAIAAGADGSLYVADSGNNTIRKIDSQGNVTTIAGLAGTSGSANGTGSAARFSVPSGIAIDRAANVYVADRNNDQIRKITPAGVVTTFAGAFSCDSYRDGAASVACFSEPESLAIDGSGNVYVGDSLNDVIRKISPLGLVTTIAGKAAVSGSLDGTGDAARFNGPASLAFDGSATLYVSDRQNHALRIIR